MKLIRCARCSAESSAFRVSPSGSEMNPEGWKIQGDRDLCPPCSKEWASLFNRWVKHEPTETWTEVQIRQEVLRQIDCETRRTEKYNRDARRVLAVRKEVRSNIDYTIEMQIQRVDDTGQGLIVYIL